MKSKVILIILGFAFGILAMALFNYLSSEKHLSVTYLQELEIEDLSPEMIRVRGAYIDSSDDINMILLECYLQRNICNEIPVFITKEGIVGIVQSKEYAIIDKSPTRIVAKYEGLEASHVFTIDLATKQVAFKNEDNDSSSFRIYELGGGEAILRQINSVEN